MPETAKRIILDSQTPEQECYRCGYDLRGTDDAGPCPECGLLAKRSRRASDELRHTRPVWLRRLARGSRLLLLAILIAAAWPFIIVTAFEPVTAWLVEVNLIRNWQDAMLWLPLFGFDAAAVLILAGVWLLTSPEGYGPADRADRMRRWALRIAATAPLFSLLLWHTDLWLTRQFGWNYDGRAAVQIAATALVTVLAAPLPLLGFFQLRSLAKRARSAHLAEHCAIVGVGAAAALVYLGIVVMILSYAHRWIEPMWASQSQTWLVLMLVVGVAAGLFTLWSLYLLIRFAIAFRRTSRQLDQQWRRDDRATNA